jgi:hypothetical protein
MTAQDTIEAVVSRHIAAFKSGDAAAIAADYAENAILLTKATGPVSGREAIRQTFAAIFGSVFPPATTSMQFEPLLAAGEIGLLHWTAITPNIRTVGAFDSFVVRHGKIVAQTGGGELVPLVSGPERIEHVKG